MAGQKKVCQNCNRKFNSNEFLVKHMMKSLGCANYIIKCPGCNKSCASQEHYQNHIRQAQKDGFRCYDVSKKMDIVSTLELNNLKSTKQDVVSANTNSHHNRGIKNNEADSSSSSSVQPSQLLFAVEQKVPPKRNNVSISIDTFYGINSNYGHEKHSISSGANGSRSMSLSSKKMIDVANTVFHPPNIEEFSKRQKVSSNVSDKDIVLYPQDDSMMFKKPTSSEMNRIISAQRDLYMSGSKNRSMNLFNTKLSDGNSYDVCVPVNDLRYFPRSETIHDDEVSESRSFGADDQEDEPLAYDFYDLTQEVNSETINLAPSRDNNNIFIENDNNVIVDPPIPPPTADNFHSQYISDRCKFNSSHRDKLLWEDTDAALIELYNIHKKCRAPIGLFDQTIDWLQHNASKLFNKSTGRLNKLKKRKPFMKYLYKKVYGHTNVHKVLPTLLKTDIPRYSTSIDSTVFDFREVVISLLSNNEVMDPENLLFASDSDPFQIHPVGSPITSVINSDVFRRAHKRLCKKQNDVLWPLVVYNDEFNCDHNGKLKLDPLSISFLRLPVHIRNQSKAWRTFGIVHSLQSSSFDKVLDSEEKMQIHHIVLEKMYKMVSILQKEDGIPWTLSMKDGSKHNVSLKLYIQLVVGDTKGHDEHCGRKSGHMLEMKQCVRDCHVSMNDSDKWSHICNFRKLSDIFNRPKEHRYLQSFHNIENCYRDIDMGDEIHGIFGATCGEPLHVLGQGLDVYAFERFMSSLCADSERTLKTAVMNLVPIVGRQSSSKNLPSVSAFRNGLTKLNILTADEKFARLFVIYIALLTSDCCKKLSENPKKGDARAIFGLSHLKKWFHLIESMLCLTLWLKTNVIPVTDLYNPSFLETWKQEFESEKVISDYDIDYDSMAQDSRAQKRIVQLLKLYHSLIGDRAGNGVKLPKFHLMLHVVRNIIRHGPVENYDTARLEANAKESGKTPALRTQKQHKTISYQTAARYHEDLTVLEAENLLFQCCGVDAFSSNRQYSYFNKAVNVTSHATGSTGISHSPTSFTTLGSSRFRFILNRDNRIDNPNMRTAQLRWKNNNKIPEQAYNDKMLHCLMNWLWVDSRGGRISETSVCEGFTEIQLNGCTYRAHPYYRDNGPWYDWAMIKWEGSDDPIPGKIYMFFELNPETVQFISEENHVNEEDASVVNLFPADLRSDSSMKQDFIRQHRYWAIVHSAQSSKLAHNSDEYTRYHLQSKLSYRVLLESEKYRLVPIDSIVGPAYAFMNYSLTDSVFDNTAIVISPKQEWAEKFLDN